MTPRAISDTVNARKVIAQLSGRPPADLAKAPPSDILVCSVAARDAFVEHRSVVLLPSEDLAGSEGRGDRTC